MSLNDRIILDDQRLVCSVCKEEYDYYVDGYEVLISPHYCHKPDTPVEHVGTLVDKSPRPDYAAGPRDGTL